MKNTSNIFIKFKSKTLNETSFVPINSLIISGIPLDEEENEMDLEDGSLYEWKDGPSGFKYHAI